MDVEDEMKTEEDGDTDAEYESANEDDNVGSQSDIELPRKLAAMHRP